MKTLVTGAGGQVGVDLIRSLIASGDEVVATDIRERPSFASDLPESLPWRTLDVTDPDAVTAMLEEGKFDRVFHLAAILSAAGEKNPGLTYRVNQGGLYNVLEGCRISETRQLIFTSTIAVFGPNLEPDVGDEVPLRPTTMYGVTKASGEMLGEYYKRRYGLDFRAVRFPGLISASLPGGGTSDYALYLYVDGVRRNAYEAFCHESTRIPLMYMPDGIRALVELANADIERLTRCTYNIAAFSPTAREIGDSVASELGTQPQFTFVADPVRQSILDSWPNRLLDDAARSDWDWNPKYDLTGMTRHLIPEIRALLAANADAFDH